jgi:hypothetical protein
MAAFGAKKNGYALEEIRDALRGIHAKFQENIVNGNAPADDAKWHADTKKAEAKASLPGLAGVNLLIMRPNQEVEMGDAVVYKGNGAAGFAGVGTPLVNIASDGMFRDANISVVMHTGIIPQNPHVVRIVPCVRALAGGCIGGGGAEFEDNPAEVFKNIFQRHERDLVVSFFHNTEGHLPDHFVPHDRWLDPAAPPDRQVDGSPFPAGSPILARLKDLFKVTDQPSTMHELLSLHRIPDGNVTCPVISKAYHVVASYTRGGALERKEVSGLGLDGPKTCKGIRVTREMQSDNIVGYDDAAKFVL